MTAGLTLTSLGSVFTASAAATVRGVIGAVHLMVQGFRIIPNAIQAYRNRGPVLRMLELDDRMLRDIGITRGDITSALSGSPVSDPSTRLRIYAVERRAGIRAQARERLSELQQQEAPAPRPAAPKLRLIDVG